MYKAVILYFSGTGNTWWVANKIKKQLDANDINADIVSIDSIDSKKANWWIKTADLVLFGWPIYGSDLPEPMKVFIENLVPIKKGKHVHTFCTQMAFSGDGAWGYHKHFEKKGLIIDSTEHFNMPSNLSFFGRILGPPKSIAKINKTMNKSEIHIEKYAANLMKGKSKITGKYSYPLGILQRGPYRLGYRHLQNFMGVDETRCTKCAICESLCSSANIKMTDYPKFLGKCALCLRCYAFCPESAVTFMGKSRNIKKNGEPYSIHDTLFKPTMLK